MFGIAGRSAGEPCESRTFGMNHMACLVELEKLRVSQAGAWAGSGEGTCPQDIQPAAKWSLPERSNRQRMRNNPVRRSAVRE